MTKQSGPLEPVSRSRAQSPTDSEGHETRRYESQHLLGQADRAYIHHEGRWYCLRRTKQGKLILTA
jgi:hemin uptake protein HemP